MSTDKLVYLDHNATTRIAPEVIQSMLPCLTNYWGNPSSAYSLAIEPARLIEEARESAARLIGSDKRHIVFTSCGTESNNTAEREVIQRNR